MSERVVLVLEDTPGRVDRMRAALPLPLRVFARARDLLAWLDGEHEPLALITLDYHLASRADGNGMDVAQGLSGRAPLCPVIVHTSDTTAAAGVALVLRTARWEVACAPFEGGGWLAAARRALSTGPGS